MKPHPPVTRIMVCPEFSRSLELTALIVSAPNSAHAASRGRVAVSIVSHRHTDMVQGLLAELCDGHGGWVEHVIVTHNVKDFRRIEELKVQAITPADFLQLLRRQP